MTLVNIDPHVILHQKTHVPRAVNFFESQKASQHPVGSTKRQCIKNPMHCSKSNFYSVLCHIQ